MIDDLTRQAGINKTVVVSYWPFLPGALLVLGSSNHKIPRAGSARCGSVIGLNGVFRAESWLSHSLDSHAFVAVIRFSQGRYFDDLKSISLRGSRVTDQELELSLCTKKIDDDFCSHLIRESKGHHALVVQFFQELIISSEENKLSSLKFFFTRFIEMAAEDSGCIEHILQTQPNRVVLQGWGADNISHSTKFIQINDFEFMGFAAFAREDLQSSYDGSLLLFGCSGKAEITKIKALYFLADNNLFKRTIIDHHILVHDDAIGQFRYLFPNLRYEFGQEQAFRELLRPVFCGRETLTECKFPIKAAVDIAVLQEGVGIYLCGWILDFKSAIHSIKLYSKDLMFDVSSQIVEVERDDVISAFVDDVKRHKLSKTISGFNAFIKTEALDWSETYIQFNFVDNDVAFLPVDPVRFACADSVMRVLGTLDRNKKSFLDTISRAVGPFAKTALAAKQSNQLVNYQRFPIRSEFMLVIPISRNVIPRAMISCLMRAGILDDEMIVFVCNNGMEKDSLIEIRHLLNLYQIDSIILENLNSTSPINMILEIVLQSGSRKVIVASDDCSGLDPQSRARLYRDLDCFDIALPTILYSDNSIKSTNRVVVEVGSSFPFVTTRSYLSGLSAGSQIAVSNDQQAGGSFDCIALKVASIANMPALRGYLTKSIGELAFFKEARRLELTCNWNASVAVTCPSEHEREDFVRLTVDSWMFAQAGES